MIKNQKLEYISIDDLKLDLENPRLPINYRNSSEEKIIEYMIFHGAINELMQSISVNGFFAGEPLVVIPDNGKFIVVEGNRRLSALKLLHNPSLTDEKKVLFKELNENTNLDDLSLIPCVKFEKREDTLQFLGFKHIVGIKDWSPLEKAYYIRELNNKVINKKLSLNDKCTELAKMIGSKSDYIRRLIVGYDIFLIIKNDYQFFNIEDLDETTFIFVNLTDSLNRKSIKEFLCVDFTEENPLKDLNIENLEYWTKWLFEEDKDSGDTLLKGMSSHLTVLSKIIQNEEALKCLKENKLEKAKLLIEDSNELLDQYLFNVNIILEKAIKISNKSIVDLQINDYQDSIEKIKKSLKKLNKKIMGN